MGSRPRDREDAGLVYPVQSGAIAILLVVAMGVVFWRLAGRRPSRMSRALVTIGGILLGLVLVGVVLSVVSRPGAG